MAVEKPDFDELGFHSNTHFYYPVKSMYRPRESFFDFDGLHNARAKYHQHIAKFCLLLNIAVLAKWQKKQAEQNIFLMI